MRALVAILVVVAARPATAEDLPPGSMGLIVGAVAGTGADSSRLGVGYVDVLSFQAAWQPMRTEQRIGWAARWSTVFVQSYNASAATVDALQTMQMDLTLGIRVRPGDSPKRYFTLRVGPALWRANQEIPPQMQRAFVGPVASVGFEHYLVGTLLLLDIDVRYGLIVNGPSEIALTATLSINGP